MNDLISRSALLRDPYFQEDRYPESHLLRMAINEAHAVDAVKVVRCKDCKHCDPENHHCDHSVGTMIYFPRKPDDFCSYGERRVDDATD